MTEIKVEKLSKRFGYQWIIRDFDGIFQAGIHTELLEIMAVVNLP